MRIFSQSLRTGVKEWFRALDPHTIESMNRFVAIFLDKWEEKKNFVKMLTAYNHLKRQKNESIKSFSTRFSSIYNSLLADCKPPEGMAKLHFAEAFDDEFALFF